MKYLGFANIKDIREQISYIAEEMERRLELIKQLEQFSDDELGSLGVGQFLSYFTSKNISFSSFTCNIRDRYTYLKQTVSRNAVDAKGVRIGRTQMKRNNVSF